MTTKNTPDAAESSPLLSSTTSRITELLQDLLKQTASLDDDYVDDSFNDDIEKDSECWDDTPMQQRRPQSLYRILSEFLQCLQRQQQLVDNNDGSNIRSLLGDRMGKSGNVARLMRTLSHYMSHRVDPHELLPSTYDDEANQHAMQHSAITLTPLSMVAAHVYAHLLFVPGALGVGLLDLEAIQGLSSVLERWSNECRGSNTHNKADDDHEMIDGASTTHKGKRNTTQVQRRLKASLQQTKRKRHNTNRPRKEYQDDESLSSDLDDEDDGDDDLLESPLACEVESPVGTALTSSQLIVRGLEVASQVAVLPSVKDFLNWSDEAKDVIVASVVTCLATSSALKATQGPRWEMIARNPALLELMELVVNRSTTSLVTCVPSVTSDKLDSDVMTKRILATKSILKGLQPLLLYQREVPHGAKGKHEAAIAATTLLQKFIAEVALDMERHPRSWPKIMILHHDAATTGPPTDDATSPMVTTPTKTPSKESQTPKTANKSRRRSPFAQRRLSTDGKPTTPLRLRTSSTPTPYTATLLHSKSTPQQPRPVVREILALLQRLVVDPVLDVATVRHQATQVLQSCLIHLPIHERSIMVHCLAKLTKSKWWYSRHIACDILVKGVLPEKWFWEQQQQQIQQPFDSSYRQNRVVQTPGITSPALDPKSDVYEQQTADYLLECIVERLDDKDRSLRVCCSNGLTSLLQSLRNEESSSYTIVPSLLSTSLSRQASRIARVLRESCLSEDKALARKAFIGALVELLISSQQVADLDLVLSPDDIVTLSLFCQQTSSAETSKAAAEGLTTLLESYPRSDTYNQVRRSTFEHDDENLLRDLEEAWTNSVLPLALEGESRMSNKIVSLFERIVWKPIVKDSHQDHEDAPGRDASMTAWNIVGHASRQSRGIESLSVMLRKCISEANSHEQLMGSLMKAIVSAASYGVDLNESPEPEADELVRAKREGVWTLFKATLASTANLSDLTRPIKKHPGGLGFVVERWNHMVASLVNPYHRAQDWLVRSSGQCLEVMGALAPQLHDNLAADALVSIERRLCSFELPKSIIGSAISTLLSLTISPCDARDSRDLQQQCATKIRSLLTKCEEALVACAAVVLQDDPESKLARALFTVGELCLVGFSEDEDISSGNSKNTKRNSDPLLGIHERPTKMLGQLVQTYLSSTMPNSSGLQTPTVVRSLAFLTLGKMCLRDEALTVKSVTLFARELHEGGHGSAEVQANALIVFGDLCVRYANHVDRFLPLMANCLQSGVSKDMEMLVAPPQNGFELVRVQAVHLLSNLIMQDYIKWRGLLFHRFLVATADDDERVALVAENTLCGPLLTKKPQLFVQNFVESLFVLNRCTTHPIYKSASMSGDGGSGVAVDFEGIHFNGALGSARRHHIYKMMLTRMSDEQKIGVTARIAKEVLGNALEQGNDLHALCNFPNTAGIDLENHPSFSRAVNVLRDALTVLRCKYIRVSRRKDEESSSSLTRQNKVDAIKGELLSNINRTQLIEVIIPIVLNLKATLHKNRSPLLKDLMGYLLVVYESYPDKVKDFLSNEPQILMEIEHDARVSRRSRQSFRESVLRSGTRQS